jgi:mannose-6-phosphate isomerase
MTRRLRNPVRRYAWGSTQAIPRLLGVPPDGQPQAELWLGAHERAASRVAAHGADVGAGDDETESLLDVVRRDPHSELGDAWAAGARMPFLAKVVAVAEPLSLQVHPNAERAAEGFAEEEARGVRRDAPRRSFPDDVAKVEMAWALSPFRALCGFRACDQAVAWLQALDVGVLKPTAEALRDHGRAALGPEVSRLLRLTSATETVAEVRARARVLHDDPRWRESAAVAADLAARYPHDPAVCLALLLEPWVLAPGEALVVRPGQPHCYLSGTAFEVQANSDNVLRAGLTGKHVDVDLLLQALDTGADHTGAAITAVRAGAEHVLAPDTDRFALSVLHDTDGAALPAVPGPQVFWCVDGPFWLADGTRETRLGDGESVYVSAIDGPPRVRGTGTLLRVTTGRKETR